MNSTDGQFPDTLVLAFNTLATGDSGCPADLKTQIEQGNTFSVGFDMTHAPHAPGQNGEVFLTTDPQSNFVAAERVELANEGLSDRIGFMSLGQTQATIFGQTQTVTRVFLLGTPTGNVFTWQAGMLVGDNCAVMNGPSGDELMSKLTAG